MPEVFLSTAGNRIKKASRLKAMESDKPEISVGIQLVLIVVVLVIANSLGHLDFIFEDTIYIYLYLTGNVVLAETQTVLVGVLGDLRLSSSLLVSVHIASGMIFEFVNFCSINEIWNSEISRPRKKYYSNAEDQALNVLVFEKKQKRKEDRERKEKGEKNGEEEEKKEYKDRQMEKGMRTEIRI
uniref:Uncharacterized protein n=1 Tax=Romanomermis culicivorax TaxID=13658 RepID=A0A915IVP9_ROMCU